MHHWLIEQILNVANPCEYYVMNLHNIIEHITEFFHSDEVKPRRSTKPERTVRVRSFTLVR